MGTIRVRFIVVALVVSFFAVGMAAFLNYFKYKSTISGQDQEGQGEQGGVAHREGPGRDDHGARSREAGHACTACGER